jgi:hypothetical protein
MNTPATIGGIVAPDSALARHAVSLIERVHNKSMLNHLHRTWWFAALLGKKRELTYDRELVYLASMLHDLGLTEEFAADKRFDVDGADAAVRILQQQGYPETKTRVVWDAIALHALGDIADRREPEVALVHMGAHVDVMGLWIDEITPSLIDDTLALYPRLGMKAAFTEALAQSAKKKPHKAIGTGLADVGRRLVHGLEIPNVCDLINAAPFES